MDSKANRTRSHRFFLWKKNVEDPMDCFAMVRICERGCDYLRWSKSRHWSRVPWNLVMRIWSTYREMDTCKDCWKSRAWKLKSFRWDWNGNLCMEYWSVGNMREPTMKKSFELWVRRIVLPKSDIFYGRRYNNKVLNIFKFYIISSKKKSLSLVPDFFSFYFYF